MSLSDKIRFYQQVEGCRKEDVKEFIKKLKGEFCKCKDMTKEPESAYRRIQIEMNNQCKHHIIDKLAGEDLI